MLFVVVSGLGWLIDTSVFMTLSGVGRWQPTAANVVSGSCGALFVFAVSARGIFRRNRGSLAQKILVLLAFNLVVIVISSFVLGFLTDRIDALALRMAWSLPSADIKLAAKILVTPVTLVLNFVVVRFLLERFVGLRLGGDGDIIEGEEVR